VEEKKNKENSPKKGKKERNWEECPWAVTRAMEKDTAATAAVQRELLAVGQHAAVLQVPPILLRLPPPRRPEEVGN
jgi:hypothetical protein